MFINLPHLQKHLYRGQAFASHSASATPQGSGRAGERERESLAWPKGGKTDRVISIKRMWGEKLSFITYLGDIYTSTFFPETKSPRKQSKSNVQPLVFPLA